MSISGVRGIYGQDLNLHEVAKFTKSFVPAIRSGKCVIARDTRPSSRIISQIAAAILMSAGIDVYNLGVAPTPMAFRESRKYGAGVIITASHNPTEWNGMKFVIDGRGLFERELQIIQGGDSHPESSQSSFGKEYEVYSSYIDEVVSLLNQGGGSANNQFKMKVGIDCGGGAACGLAEQLFQKLGHKVFSINSTPGISSRGPDPTSDELIDLRALVTANQLDHGFALDLDSDRLVVVTREGQKLNPDATLLLCIARTIQMGMKRFVVSTDTSVSIEKFIKERAGGGSSVVYSKVGEANVVAKMLETGADAGGEGSSAGFILPKFNMCRDGFLASAMVSLLDKGVISDCLRFASQYRQIRSKFPADSSQHASIISSLEGVFRKESSEIQTQDGLKAITDEDSWVLVRPSNTEHAIRISVESKAARVEQLYKQTSEKVQRVYEQIR